MAKGGLWLEKARRGGGEAAQGSGALGRAESPLWDAVPADGHRSPPQLPGAMGITEGGIFP